MAAISNFRGLVTLTVDRVILHTVVHHSSTYTYRQDLIEIKKTFCGRTSFGRLKMHGVISYSVLSASIQFPQAKGLLTFSEWELPELRA